MDIQSHKQFKAEYLPEALEQLIELSKENREKILSAIETFELIGTAYKNLNDLGQEKKELENAKT